MKLEHVAFNVNHPREMAQWYAQNLDMKIVRADPEPPYIRFLADKAGQSMIEFYNNPAVTAPDYGAIDPLVLHIAFAVVDIEATRDRLIAAGATAVNEIVTHPSGDKMAFLRDPWRMTIQLILRQKSLI